MTAEDVIRILDLKPLEFEGGFFRETYRSGINVLDRCGATRSAGTAIYYLLTPETCSRLHRLPQDEVWHFYSGDPATLLLLHERRAEVVSLGPDIAAGQRPQIVVPANVWQGAMVTPGGSWTLLGTTAAPGFDRDDFEPAERRGLLAAFPKHEELIRRLT
uniref:Cupin domain-containing protein n=1 Tax=candidate division WOR-3 bacterium TaxID=2052148 RepID=A0A7C4GA86_UNCW3